MNPNASITVTVAIAELLSYLRLQVTAGNLSPNTVSYYSYALARLDKALGHRPLAKISLEDLLLVPRTRAFVRSFRRLLAYHHLSEPAGLQAPPEGQRQRVLTASDWNRLRRAAIKSIRWMLTLQYRTGMRPWEVRQLTWGMIREKERVIRLESFKAKDRRRDGLKVRWIPLDRMTARLFGWVRKRLAAKAKAAGEAGPNPTDFVFLTRFHRPYSCNAYLLGVRYAREKAGLLSVDGEAITAYTTRHSFATEWVEASLTADRPVDVTMLKDVMGHANLSTTCRYLHRKPEDLVKGLDQTFQKRRRA